MKTVHQFVPTFEPSAIGNHVVQIQKTLRDAGYQSEVFAEHTRGAFEGTSHVHTDYGRGIQANAEDVLIYHMATGSVVADFLAERDERLMVDHHNITPVSLYQPWDPSVTYGMTWGRHQLAALAKRASASFADSEFNRRELDALGYTNTSVVPILLDFDSFEHSIDAATSATLAQAKARGGTDWLFVGWVSPHKCQHDIIRAFAMYRAVYDPNARLHLVGRVGAQTYSDACESLIKELGQDQHVFLHGAVSDGELGAHFRNADVLISMSEHEGVGIPLLEAMYHEVPVVAYAAAAVPETVGEAGILLADKRPAVVAAAVHRVVNDKTLTTALVERGRQRLPLFSLEQNRRRLLAALETLGS